MAVGQHTEVSDAQTQQPQDVAQQAQDKAQQVAQQAQQQGQQIAAQARDRMRGQVDQRTTDAGEQLESQAGDIRTVAEQLRGQGKDRPAQIAEQAADRAERVGSYLKESDAERIINDVEDFARKRPWAVVAGGIALGAAAARFLKASSMQRYSGQARKAPGTPSSPMATTSQVTADGAAVDESLGDGAATGLREGTNW